jgi:hypothetical protein
LNLKIDELQSPAAATRSRAAESTPAPRSAPTTATLPPARLPAMTLRCFADDGALHPMEFLKQIEKYTAAYNVPDAHQIDIAVDHLEGAPQDWATAFSDQWETWDEFRRAFVSRYWSLSRQDAIVAEFMNTVYSKGAHHSMTRFLLHWMGKLKFVTPPLDPARFLRQFIHSLPANIFNILVASNIRSTAELLQVLQRMDEGATRRGQRQASVNSDNQPKVNAAATHANDAMTTPRTNDATRTPRAQETTTATMANDASTMQRLCEFSKANNASTTSTQRVNDTTTTPKVCEFPTAAKTNVNQKPNVSQNLSRVSLQRHITRTRKDAYLIESDKPWATVNSSFPFRSIVFDRGKLFRQ